MILLKTCFLIPPLASASLTAPRKTTVSNGSRLTVCIWSWSKCQQSFYFHLCIAPGALQRQHAIHIESLILKIRGCCHTSFCKRWSKHHIGEPVLSKQRVLITRSEETERGQVRESPETWLTHQSLSDLRGISTVSGARNMGEPAWLDPWNSLSDDGRMSRSAHTACERLVTRSRSAAPTTTDRSSNREA